MQIVCGEGPDVGPALVDHADFVMFTGSTATGRFVGERAGRNLIDCTLELGGKNPLDRARPTPTSTRSSPGALFGVVPQRRPGLHAHRADLRAARRSSDGVHPQVRDRRREDQARCDVRLRSRRWAALVSPDHLERVSRPRRGRARQGRRGADRRPRAARPRPDVLRADRAARRHQGDEARRRGDLRSGDDASTPTTPSTRPSRWPTTPTTASTRASGATDLDGRRGGRPPHPRPATSTSTTASPAPTPARRRRRAA